MGQPKRGILSRNLSALAVSEFSSGLQFWVPVWVAYELRYITLAQLPVIEAIMAGSQLILELPTGAFADLVGKRWSVILGNLCSVLGLAVYLVARSFPTFVVYALLLGIADSLISGAKEALLYDSAKQEGQEADFSKHYAKLSLYNQIGLAVSILLGGLVGTVNPMYAIALTVVSRLVAFVASLYFIEPVVDTEKFTFRRYVNQIRDGTKEIVRTPHVRDVSLLYIGVGGISWVCQLVFNATLLTTLGHSALEMGVFFSSIRIINGTLLFKALNIGKFLTKQRAVILFPLALTAAMLPGIWYAKYWAMIPLWVIVFVSTGRWVVLSQYTNDEFSSRHRATAISALSMAIGGIYVVMTLVSGPLMGRFGGPGIMYTLLGVLTAVFVVPVGMRLYRSYAVSAVRTDGIIPS
jgi:MFS family permease